MRDRRFLLLAATLVVLNTALWLAPGAFGLSSGLATLFGKNMVRATLVENSGCPSNCLEVRLDRGSVVSNKSGVLTLSEADTRTQAIAVDSSTKVIVTSGKQVGINGIKTGWHVLVQWPAAGGPAQTVWIEKRGH